jgi:hypothetical protein
MDTRSMIFVTIDKLVSPSSSVNGDPLDDFPEHWQPRFSVQFPLRRTMKDRLARALRTKDLSGLGLPGKAGPSSRRVCCLACATYETRFLHIGGR